MLRETVFALGGVLLLVMSGLLLLGLLWAAAGWIFFEAYVGVGAGLLFGAFFLSVARESRADRRALLAQLEPGAPPPAAPPPGG